MSSNRKIVGATAFILALAGGGVAGALLGTPEVTSAQDADDDPTTTETDDATTAPSDRLGRERGGHRLATAAEALGISEAELRTALEGGQSIEQVAEAQGVDSQTVVDALVADATERLEAAIEELPERMTALVEREGLPDRPAHHHGGRFGAGLEAAATAIGITEDELRTALGDGSTLAEVAAANDVELDALVAAMVAEASTRIDEAVAAGRLTEQEATERKAGLEERITALVNGERPERPADDDEAEAEGTSA